MQQVARHQPQDRGHTKREEARRCCLPQEARQQTKTRKGAQDRWSRFLVERLRLRVAASFLLLGAAALDASGWLVGLAGSVLGRTCATPATQMKGCEGVRIRSSRPFLHFLSPLVPSPSLSPSPIT